MATYSLGCRDCCGNHLADDLPMGPQRNRIFDPSTDPRFMTTLDTPNALTVTVLQHELRYLCYGDCFVLTNDDEKKLKKAMKKAGLGNIIKNGVKNKMV